MAEIKFLYPKTIVYEVTNRCNLRCEMCAQNYRNFNYADLDIGVIEKTGNLLKTAHDVSLFGWGEPLLARNFLKMFEKISKYPPDIFVLTNGMFLDKEIGEAFIKGRLKYLNFSLDAPDEDLYNKIRRGSDFNRVINNITRFMKQCKDLGYFPYTRFVMVLMKQNIEYFPKLIEFASHLGINEVKGIYLIAYSENMRNESLYFYKDLTNKIFDKTQELAEKLNLKLTLPDRFGTGSNFFHKECLRPYQELYVQSNGKVRACCFSNEIMGDLTKEDFFQVWNNSKFIDLRKKVNSNNPPEDCKNCCHYRHSNIDILESHMRIDMKVPNTSFGT